jgi:hypothetical protein
MTSAVDYGVDCSFPVKSTELRCGNLLGDRKKVYEEYMRGCREHAGPKRASMCDRNELDRFDMSTNQQTPKHGGTFSGETLCHQIVFSLADLFLLMLL